MKKKYKLEKLLFILNKYKVKTPLEVMWTDNRVYADHPTSTSELRTILSYNTDSLMTFEGGFHNIDGAKDFLYEPLKPIEKPKVNYLPAWF